jgi:GT2 family glycosyltransferase
MNPAPPVVGEHVCAVVVTFNRKLLLRTCLESLLAQTRPIDHILIINNASSDGTEALLAEEFPQLEVVHMGANTGGAGGFHEGMKRSLEAGYDWVWVMDDDIRMRPDALEVMLGYGHLADLIQCRKLVNGQVLVWEAIWDANACAAMTYTREASFDNGRDWTSISYCCFEGVLIRRALIERAGLPDTRYFVIGDDTTYGFIASQHGHLIYIRYAGVEKAAGQKAVRSRMLFYLGVRNRFLTYETFKNCGVPVNRNLFLMHQLYFVFSSCAEILRDPKLRNWPNLKAPVQGFVHGLQNRFGKPYWIA